ncbi:MAG: cbb3-type cytochrome c oxidase subunit I [Bacteroidetes bacterium]|nr:cbb3-type cytochrome c oxidase subunit I [Bacteroidota bacterium]MBP6638778.1 cbb3-type cytochrome c oxidase subunit I [Bacteroidia bacterium]MBP6720724.1 cbb3-type cytochrome c oxidase subunit I [Bacteroidia bacterium]MBP8073311.1 cbb3-type cytochrome c oxidase subunit I [Bacteroidia bacterium]
MADHAITLDRGHEEAHGHDHDHEHEHHKQTFITKYVFSQDHKTIAKQFMFTGIFMAMVGLFMSLIFRLQLAWPDAEMPWLESIIGKWGEGGKLDPNFYLALVTMHGTIMVFFVLTAGLSGTFSNFLIPLQVGARDMASGFMNMLSYWFFFLSSVIMLGSIFVTNGPAGGGWTIYPPLSALPAANPGSGLGMDMFLVSMAFFIVSSLLGSINYITTIINLRTKGLSMTRLPLTCWAFMITAILGTLSFPVLFAAALLLLMDRNFGTSFFLSDIYIGGEALPNEGGSPVLFQHLFWFLGHPEVYIVLLPALGITSEIISTMSRKPIFGYRAMVGSMLAIGILSFVVWAHHMYVTGMNPWLGTVFMLLTLIIAVPSAVKAFNYITTLWQGDLKFSPAMLFSIGLVSMFISGGVTGIFLGNAAIDIPLHDTYFVVAHFHMVMGSAAAFGFFAGIYHWFPKMFGKMMDPKLGTLHFWFTFLSLYLVFYPMHFIGMGGVPRRYYTYSTFQFTGIEAYMDLSQFITISAIIGVFAQFIFIYNLFVSIRRGKEAPMNPWGSNTLEWTTPIHPGHGNWPGEIPTVYRWPYDYSRPGLKHDYLPMHIPDNDPEWFEGAPDPTTTPSRETVAH